MGPGFLKELVRGLKAHGTTRDFVDSARFDPDFFTRSTAESVTVHNPASPGPDIK